MTDDVVAFLRAAHEEIERVANAAQPPGVWYRVFRTVFGEHEVVLAEDGQMPEHLDPEDVTWVHTRADGDHITLHDPRSALARVQAERAILASYEHADREYRRQDRGASPDYLSGQLAGAYGAVLDLAHGHRHTIPGYRPEWTPEGVEVTA